ncbi:MAG TPA: hypothetical protein EYQ31_03210, partial [Candidatus Handelsmanbacteria bacterium]|nr:hypothetical protein [Candidatus Handelsmanbacteria bacterium]
MTLRTWSQSLAAETLTDFLVQVVSALYRFCQPGERLAGTQSEGQTLPGPVVEGDGTVGDARRGEDLPFVPEGHVPLRIADGLCGKGWIVEQVLQRGDGAVLPASIET